MASDAMFTLNGIVEMGQFPACVNRILITHLAPSALLSSLLKKKAQPSGADGADPAADKSPADGCCRRRHASCQLVYRY